MNAAYGLDRVCPDGLYVSATDEITLMPDNILSPKRIAAEAFTDAAAAVDSDAPPKGIDFDRDPEARRWFLEDAP